MELHQAQSANDIEMARELFQEYARSLDVDLCFQNFKKELAHLPGDYAPPAGRLLLAFDRGRAAGCIALRRITDEIGEMKRLYVRPEFRSKGLGRQLTKAIMSEARAAGYMRVRLDTLPSMREALALYGTLGFEIVEPYRYNPVQGALYMEAKLEKQEPDASQPTRRLPPDTRHRILRVV